MRHSNLILCVVIYFFDKKSTYEFTKSVQNNYRYVCHIDYIRFNSEHCKSGIEFDDFAITTHLQWSYFISNLKWRISRLTDHGICKGPKMSICLNNQNNIYFYLKNSFIGNCEWWIRILFHFLIDLGTLYLYLKCLGSMNHCGGVYLIWDTGCTYVHYSLRKI